MAKSKKFKKLKRKILNSGFVIAIITQLLYWYLKLVALTSKWERKGIDNIEELWNSGKNGLIVGWHGRAIMLPLFWNFNSPVVALVSPHNDGRLIAGILHKLGVKTIDGSSNENAKSAAVNIVRSLNTNNSIVMVPDGPRGPRMKLNPSTIYFAQKTGVPIYTVSYSMKKAKTIAKSWDQMLIPRPFGHGMIVCSKPFYIPKNATVEELEQYRLKVEKSAIDVQNTADDFAGIPHIMPETKAKQKKHKRP